MAQALTVAFCQSAKVEKGRKDFYDAKCTGLTFNVTASGTKTWYVFWRCPTTKKAQRTKLGRYPLIDLASARIKARDMLNSIAKGDVVAGTGRYLVSDLCADFLKRYSSAKRSEGLDRQMIERDVMPVIGKMPVARVRRGDLVCILDAIMDRGSPAMANRTQALLSTMFRWAVECGHIDHSPAEGVRKPAKDKPRNRVLSDAEIAAVWNAFTNIKASDSTRDVLRLLLLTGQRSGEVLGMTWQEVDLAAATWTIPAERARNGRQHVVPLSGMAMRVLRKARQRAPESEIVFPSPKGGTLTNSAISHCVSGNADAFGTDRWTPHDLRRTVLTGMAKMEIAPHVIKAVANHVESGVTSRVYIRYDYLREKREALDLWADRLQAIVGGADVAKVVSIGSAAQ